MYICIIKYKEQERNMTSLTIKEATDSYWALIKDAGYEVKLALIKRLSDALKPAVAGKKNNRKKYTADDFAGMWDDESFMDADELNTAIRKARHNASSRDDFWDSL